jgi:hypothetical protein
MGPFFGTTYTGEKNHCILKITLINFNNIIFRPQLFVMLYYAPDYAGNFTEVFVMYCPTVLTPVKIK